MTTSLDPALETIVPQPSGLSRVTAAVPGAIRSFRSSPGALLTGLGILAFMVLVSVVSLVWTPYPPAETGAGPVSGAPSAAHWFGTDSVGSDVFSRTISAGRTDVLYTVLVVVIALVAGSVWGALAGFFGGWFETVTLRLLEVVQAFPALLMALFIITILGPGPLNVILVVTIIPLPEFVRLARAEVMTKKNWQFAEAARMVGNRPVVVLFKHLLPNSWRPLLAYASISAAWVCGNIAALGFIGVGIQPDAVEWGSMIARGEADVVNGGWWESFFPGMGVLLLAIGCQLIGDGIAARNRGEQR